MYLVTYISRYKSKKEGRSLEDFLASGQAGVCTAEDVLSSSFTGDGAWPLEWPGLPSSTGYQQRPAGGQAAAVAPSSSSVN